MDFVDAIFDMQPSLGSEYSGVWHDASTFIIDVGSASRQLQDYSGAYQTTPSILEDGTIVCDSFDRGAFADFSDVDREVIVSLNGVDFVRTQLTYKYYTQPYNITAMEPVTGGNTRGGTLVTLYGKGFHEFEGKRCIEELACSENPIPPKFARCRWTDGLTLDELLGPEDPLDRPGDRTVPPQKNSAPPPCDFFLSQVSKATAVLKVFPGVRGNDRNSLRWMSFRYKLADIDRVGSGASILAGYCWGRV